MRELLRLLILGSEKAANIARIIRKDESLFKLLIEEKTEGEKNARFVQDFKTLADVLIQESLRWQISKKIPEMKKNIYGEENNTFTNLNGETVGIEVQDKQEETMKMLSKVIRDENAARKLAEEIHKEMTNGEEQGIHGVPEYGLINSYENVGVWIDPIDATNEYIKGSNQNCADGKGFCKGGLGCVTVLIGAFNLHSGEPLIGVVNQPFHSYREGRWVGQVFWGTCHPQCLMTSHIPAAVPSLVKKTVIMSSSEGSQTQAKLQEKYELVFAPGAGYKLLTVILGLAHAYVLSQGTTHYWDTCGPHAILKALAGGIASFTSKGDIGYQVSNPEAEAVHYAHTSGIIAYRNKEALEDVWGLIQANK